MFFIHRHHPPPSHRLQRYILSVQRDEKATSGSSNFFVSSFLFDALQSEVGAKKGSESHGTQLIEPSSQNQHLGKPTSYHRERILKKRTLHICIHMVKRDLCMRFVSSTSDTTGSQLSNHSSLLREPSDLRQSVRYILLLDMLHDYQLHLVSRTQSMKWYHSSDFAWVLFVFITLLVTEFPPKLFGHNFKHQGCSGLSKRH